MGYNSHKNQDNNQVVGLPPLDNVAPLRADQQPIRHVGEEMVTHQASAEES